MALTSNSGFAAAKAAKGNSNRRNRTSVGSDESRKFARRGTALISFVFDRFFPEICYLTAGDTEKALLSIETQLTHNHLVDWHIAHQMPMYDQIRHEPRYQAAWAERERRLSVQRENIEKMAAETQP